MDKKPKTHCSVEMVSNSENTGASLQFLKDRQIQPITVLIRMTFLKEGGSKTGLWLYAKKTTLRSCWLDKRMDSTYLSVACFGMLND